jgi:hypothetical protein
MTMQMSQVQCKLFYLTCVPIGVVLVLLLVTPSSLMADSQVVIDSEATLFGTFKGIDYVKYEGRLTGSNYEAPFEIVVPADLSKGNGRVLVEPYHAIPP